MISFSKELFLIVLQEHIYLMPSKYNLFNFYLHIAYQKFNHCLKSYPFSHIYIQALKLKQF